MYLEHYGLTDKPFTLGYNWSYYYPKIHQDAQNDLCYSIEERQGIAILTGEPGTGKTTLLKRLLQSFNSEMHGILLSDAALSGDSLLRLVAAQFRLPAPDDATLPLILGGYLRSFLDMGHRVVLLMDEVQALTDRQLHEVRSLCDLEHENQRLLQIILAGQPSLDERLEDLQFEALRQRVAVRAHIEPLSVEHTRAYVEMRLRVAGARDVNLFTPDALASVHRFSRGVPRLINVLCDRALVLGYAEDIYVLGASEIEEASSEIKLPNSKSASAGVDAPVHGTHVLDSRLLAVERKLDRLLEAMERAGLLESETAPVGPRPLQGRARDLGAETAGMGGAGERETDANTGRVADFPPPRTGQS